MKKMRLFWCPLCWSLRLLPEDIAKLPGVVPCIARLQPGNPAESEHGPMEELNFVLEVK